MSGIKENYGIPIERYLQVQATEREGLRFPSSTPRSQPPEKPVEPPPTTPPSTPRSEPAESSNPVEQPRNTQPIPDREQVPAKYQKLRDFLKAGEWEKADRETRRVMLQVADREEEGWFWHDDLKNFPCFDLRTIDQLWVKYSNGRFGFSVQKRIWLEEGGKVDWETEQRLADRVGWAKEGKWLRRRTWSEDAPAGHLPVLILGKKEMRSGLDGGRVSSKTYECKLCDGLQK